MKHLMIATTLLLLSASCGEAGQRQNETGASIAQDSSPMTNVEEKAIEHLLAEYQKALNTSDARLAQSLYTADGVFMPTEAPSGVGAQGILDAYTFVFSQIRLHIAFRIEEIKVDRDMAYAVTSSEGTTLIHATGETVPEANRELFVFEKVDGSWKISRYMFNKTAPKG